MASAMRTASDFGMPCIDFKTLGSIFNAQGLCEGIVGEGPALFKIALASS